MLSQHATYLFHPALLLFPHCLAKVRISFPICPLDPPRISPHTFFLHEPRRLCVDYSSALVFMAAENVRVPEVLPSRRSLFHIALRASGLPPLPGEHWLRFKGYCRRLELLGNVDKTRGFWGFVMWKGRVLKLVYLNVLGHVVLGAHSRHQHPNTRGCGWLITITISVIIVFFYDGIIAAFAASWLFY